MLTIVGVDNRGVELQDELAAELTDGRLLRLLQLGLSNRYRRGCGAERRATPLGLSKDHISPHTYEPTRGLRGQK